MDYHELAAELLSMMQAAQKARHQKNIKESLQGEAFILHYIQEHYHSAVIPKEIASAIGVSPPRITAALEDLENKGLITREIDKDDRRKIIVKLTEKGQSVAEANKQDILRKTTTLLSMLGERDAKEYVRLMGKLTEAIIQIDLHAQVGYTTKGQNG